MSAKESKAPHSLAKKGAAAELVSREAENVFGL
jgi:hypothetical protein